jgi:hypothetical protein
VLAFYEENGNRLAESEWRQAYRTNSTAAAFVLARANRVANAADILKEAKPDLYDPAADIYLYEEPGGALGIHYAVVTAQGGGLDVVILCCGDVTNNKAALDREAYRRRPLV